ncbi:MAG: hypothetical protein QM564_10895 [Bergeyella sp.]
MKYFASAFMALLFGSMVYGQSSVSDYKYIFVPQKFKDFKTENQYKLNSQLVAALKGKQYQVLSDDKENWPDAVKLNPCRMLTAEVKNNSNMLRNRVILEFSDCKNTVVLESKGTTMIKDFDTGYPDALAVSLKPIPVSSPKEITVEVPVSVKTEPEKAKTQALKNEPAPKTAEPVKTSPSSAEAYILDGKTYQKVQLGNGQFILVNPDSSAPYATFSPAAKAGVYRVKLGDVNTLGYEESGNIVIEVPQSDGSVGLQTLKRETRNHKKD